MLCAVKEHICSTISCINNSLQGVATHIWEEHRIAAIGIVTLFVAIKARKAYGRKCRRQKWNAAGKDVIVLHGFKRATTCTNLSPFVVKLETYIRMANLQYKFDAKEPIGPKTKSPWITINGEEIADSDLIMQYLAKKFDLNFRKSLTQEQEGAARALSVMVDEHMLWGLADWRLIRDPDRRIFDLMKFPFYYNFLRPFVVRKLGQNLIAQGIGHHTIEERESMIKRDILALSHYLGNKTFMMGSEPSEVDCAVFGMVSQFVWGTPGSAYASYVQTDCTNLMQYCFRMKDKFYPDWEKCLLK